MFKTVVSLYPVLKTISEYLDPFDVVVLYMILDLPMSPSSASRFHNGNCPLPRPTFAATANSSFIDCSQFKPLNYQYLNFPESNLDTIDWDVCCRHRSFSKHEVILYMKYLNVFRLRLLFIFNNFTQEEKQCMFKYFTDTVVY